MRQLMKQSLLSLAVGYVLAHFVVLLLNHWYFPQFFWLKTAAAALLFAVLYQGCLLSSWRLVWTILGWYWIAAHLVAVISARNFDLRALEFVAVLDLESAMLWLPTVVLAAYGLWQLTKHQRQRDLAQQKVQRALALKRKLRRGSIATASASQPAPALEGESDD